MDSRRPARRNRKVELARLLELVDEHGWSPSAIVAALEKEDGVEVTKQNISARLKKLREGVESEDGPEPLLPWTVATPHTNGNTLYTSAIAYAKWRRGISQPESMLRLGMGLESALHAQNSVMVYDRKRGFMLRNRQPGDGPEVLAVS